LCSEFVAVLGISAKEFWDMTPKEGYNALKIKYKLMDDDIRLKYELSRLQNFYFLKPYDTKNKLNKPEHLYRFSWELKELEKQMEEMTEDKWEEIDRKFANAKTL
jgi:hypothetical protein